MFNDDAKVAFKAKFIAPLPDGPRNTSTNDELVAVELAVQAAMLAYRPGEIRAAVDKEISKMEQSLARPRRSPGERVTLSAMGLEGDWRIASHDTFGCALCGNTACREWPTLARVDSAGRDTGQYVYHVCECQMSSGGATSAPEAEGESAAA